MAFSDRETMPPNRYRFGGTALSGNYHKQATASYQRPLKRVKKQIGLNVAIEQAGVIDTSLPVSLLSPKDNHAD